MKIAVLGGAFNPPHFGHLLIAEQTLRFGGVDEVWLTPCYRHTLLKDLAPVKHRLAMTRLLINDSTLPLSGTVARDPFSPTFTKASDGKPARLPCPTKSERRSGVAESPHSQHLIKNLTKIKLCYEEIKNKLSGETIELMEVLKKKYPQHQFYFLIGSDNLPGFKRWGRWQELITKYDFLVYPRPGFTTNLSKYGLVNKNYRFKILNSPLLAKTKISSTLIRKKIKNQLPIDTLVSKKIADYIKKHRLYT